MGGKELLAFHCEFAWGEWNGGMMIVAATKSAEKESNDASFGGHASGDIALTLMEMDGWLGLRLPILGVGMGRKQGRGKRHGWGRQGLKGKRAPINYTFFGGKDWRGPKGKRRRGLDGLLLPLGTFGEERGNMFSGGKEQPIGGNYAKTKRANHYSPHWWLVVEFVGRRPNQNWAKWHKKRGKIDEKPINWPS
jgi:hypothetical protein